MDLICLGDTDSTEDNFRGAVGLCLSDGMRMHIQGSLLGTEAILRNKINKRLNV
jgi:hypothetical protein